MKIKLKKGLKGIPSHSSCCGFDPNVRTLLNQGKTVDVDNIPKLGKEYVEKVKKGEK